MSKTMVQFVKDNMIDPDLIGKMINDGKSTGIDIMDYLNQRIPMTEQQWDRMVSMRGYGTIVDNRDAASKKRILQAVVRMLNK